MYMDISLMNDVKISHADGVVHRMPGGQQEFHRRYGLWICHGNTRMASPPSSARPARHFEYYSLSHLLAGRGWYWTPDGGELAILPGDAVLIAPQFIHGYGGDHAPYVEDNLCFTGPLADHLVRAGVIRNGILRLGRARRLLPIIETARDPSRDAQLRANLALHNLLVALHFENMVTPGANEPPELDPLLAALRQQPERWWTVAEMAEFCDLSQAQFRRIFHARTGMAPKIYLDRLKLRLAAERLSRPRESIASVAAAFGYADAFHFSRRFKEVIGLAPRHYREQVR